MIFRCDIEAQYRVYATEIDAAIKRVLNSGRYTLAEEVSAFESDFSNYLECKFAIGVANATDGLMLAMKACNIGDGDEVIQSGAAAEQSRTVSSRPPDLRLLRQKLSGGTPDTRPYQAVFQRWP